ncbi:MAG: DUF3829 domain-containing protein [Myxococcales bacterium]|nr:DUF3829 domain-containing protein [Myxococcales bacterium]
MFFSKRSLVAALGLSVLGLAGCGSNPEAAPEGASASAAKSQATLAPAPKKIDPVITKSSRLENCVYGALALKQARDAYVASVGDAEPSATKIPQFGFEVPDAPTRDNPTAPAGSGAPSAKGSAAAPAPKSSAAATAKAVAPPKASAAVAAPKSSAAAVTPPAPSGSAGRPSQAEIARKMGPQLPFSRLIQGCKQAGNAKDLPAAELDPVLKEFQEYAQPLATTLQEASAYYAKDGYKDDAFAKGKEYHKTLTEAFGKLDAQLAKLKTAADKWTAANPVPAATEESHKLGNAALADATALLLAFDAKPIDGEKLKAAVTKLETSFNALKAFGEANKDKRDPWATAMVPPLSSLLEAAKGLSEKAADIKPANITNIVSLWDRVQKQSYSAIQRKNNEGAARGAMGPSQRMTKPRMQPQQAPAPQ